MEVSGKLDIYGPRGDLQLIVDTLTPVGQGVLFERFMRLKAQLQSEGLFDAERKRPVPAVPHAIGMTAERTAIAIGIAEHTIAWGDGRVQVVAFAAFSETDREAFQTVFEQFVEVFSERDSVQRIVRRATSFPAFLDELVAVIDG